MKKTTSVLLLSMIIGTYAHARSGGAGNGGDAIVCPDRVILLDSYEAEKMRLTVDLSNPNISTPSWRTMVNVAVKRLEKFDQYTASKLYDYAMEMVNDFEKFQMFPESRGQHVYLGYDIIAEINDSEHVSTPEGCEEHPRQMVSQRDPKFRYEYRYEFSKSLWEKMTLQDQAMTILHEAWYRIMLENGAKNSRATRYINGLVASKEFESYSFKDYLEELRATELENYIVPIDSQAVKADRITINLKKFTINYEGEIACVPGLKMNLSIKESFRLLNRRQKYIKNLVVDKMCFENSQITKIVLPQKVLENKYTLRLAYNQMELGPAVGDSPSMIFKDGKLATFEDIAFSKLYRFYYICDGREVFDQSEGCEGPYNDRDTAITKPGVITLDTEERVNSHF